jgi:hypothetical protein
MGAATVVVQADALRTLLAKLRRMPGRQSPHGRRPSKAWSQGRVSHGEGSTLNIQDDVQVSYEVIEFEGGVCRRCEIRWHSMPLASGTLP